MNIFISWSGAKSRRVALATKAFLQDVNQRIVAWFSDADISAGGRWGLELASQLEATDYGIICVTQEALDSHWILFEAGALSKSVKGSRVCPYLIDLNRRQLDGPLSQFQAKEANKEQTWEMLQSINFSMGADALPEPRLKKYFDTFWPALESELAIINRELQPLPNTLRRKLMDVLPPMFYESRRIEMYASYAGLPVWTINWNQAAIHVWYELIQVALSEKKLKALLDTLVSESQYPALLPLQEEVNEWEKSSQTRD